MIRALALLAVSLTACSPFWAGPSAPKAIVISLDGGAERIIEHAMHQGLMPNLDALRRTGTQADYAVTNFPSKTAAGHASLWTGAYGVVNGITANKVPKAGGSILEGLNGFSSEALRAEPLWSAVARSGRKALVVQATHTTPFSVYAPGGRFGASSENLLMLDGYSGEKDDARVFGVELGLADPKGWTDLPPSRRPHKELPLHATGVFGWGLFYDDPADPVDGYDTLQIRREGIGKTLATLKPGPSTPGTTDKFSPWLPAIADGSAILTKLRLFELDPALRSFALYRPPLVADRSNRPDVLADWARGTGAFILSGGEEPYFKGRLGKTIPQGGDGTAEIRLLETVRLAVEQRMTQLRYATTAYPWDLAISYLPYPDGIEHLWYGYLDPESPGYRAEVATKLQPYFEQTLGLVDDFLGEVRALDPGAIMAIVSDHGMEGLGWHFFPNALLKKADLLAVDSQGKVDLGRTKVMYSPNDGAYLMVNSTDRKGGIVPKHEVAGVLEKAKAALALAIDPKTGKQVVTASYHAPDALRHLGGPGGGDLYLDLLPGYYPNASVTETEAVKTMPAGPFGGHIFDPTRPSMRAIFYLNGPGVKQGMVLPPVRTIDLAPTLSYLMRVAAPSSAQGRVLIDALD